MLKKIYRKIKKRKIVVPKETTINFNKSYSQCGEDLIIQYLFRLRGVEQPTYMDLGANNPFYLSNTALFYNKGCRGVNVEANPFLIGEFNKHRTQDINLNIGVGADKSVLDFYVVNDSTLSSFSKEEANKFIETGKYHIVETLKVEVCTINEIVDTYFKGVFPDFMSLDVEGLDFDILKSIDFDKSSPKVICVEAAEYSPIGAGERRTDLIDFLETKGYYEYANTNLNAIMVRKDFWFI